jgi:hypothetical protein
MLDIREVLRRLQLGETDRRIARDLQLSRKTVGKYRLWAQQQGVLGSPLPDAATLQALLRTTLPVTPPPTMPSTVATFHDRVVGLLCGVRTQSAAKSPYAVVIDDGD